MKPAQKTVLLAALAIVVMWGAAPAQAAQESTPYDEVVSTSHNVTGAETAAESCIGCHLPEEAADLTEEEKLLSIQPMWGGGTVDGTFLVGTDPMNGDTTQSCLSCHDGVLAKGVTQPDAEVIPEKGGSNHPDHPVQITYPRNEAGTFVVATPLPQNRQFFSIPDIAGGTLLMPTGPTSPYQNLADMDEAHRIANAVRSRDGKLHCESCHNPHDNTVAPYLRQMPPNLCLVCHDK